MNKKPFLGILIFSVLGVFLWQISLTTPFTSNGRNPNAPRINTLTLTKDNPNPHQPIVSEPTVPTISSALRDLTAPDTVPLLDREIVTRGNPLQHKSDNVPTVDPPDPLRYSIDPLRYAADLLQNFDGMDNIGGYVPPDTVGEIGPNHYVQMVNKSIAIYSKTGQLLIGPKSLQQFWQGIANCSQGGDPIVIYDSLADRWLLSQFAHPQDICIAISRTADPAGDYFLYNYDVGSFPDYAKIGVWPDGYYMAANENSYTAYAFDRNKMLNGEQAEYQKFSGQTNMLMPSDLDGAAPPPANAPNYFYTFKDDQFHGGADRLEIYALDVDWLTPANSTFKLVSQLPTTPFTYTVCDYFNFDCIPQAETSQRLDAISEWPMWRLQYRNFGTYETLVGNFIVDVGSDQAGIRWFELRNSGNSKWQLYQEGTHAPDNANYWLGSIAMDRAGNIAMGYSVSSNSMFPSIRYATRLKSDPLGTLPGEKTLVEGAGSQTFFDRWGDYSSLNIDPADDCTFWYTNEYYSSSSSSKWQTRISAFRIPSCINQVKLPIIFSNTN